MTYTTKAGGQPSPSFLFPELSDHAKRSSDTTLSLFADAPAVADIPNPLITTVQATTKASPPLQADAARESMESSVLAQNSQGAAFQKGVALVSAPAVAMNSHQVLSDSLSGASTAAALTSMAPSFGCRASSVLAVSTVEAAAARDTTADQAPLVLGGVVTLGTGVDLSRVFQLHSNPTATKTIFLDFDGYAINNSIWENGGNLSLKGFYTTFDSGALTEIQRIWQRVAEDFSPFNVNVTTQDPGTEALRKFGTGDDRWGIRVAFTSNLNLLTGKAIINAGGGGTAYYNSFNWSTDDVALVFNRGEYSAAETASHETGHTLGLKHDGSAQGGEYYAGHGGTGPTSWGAIMGAAWLGNDENLTQWSKGEYTGANNTQDDLAMITNGSNGFTYAADDHANSFTSATALTGLSFSSFGVIERNTDIDMFRFDTGAGLVSFNIVNASRAFINSGGTYTTEYLTARGANLDIAASLFRADGSLVQTFNPADLTTASFSINLDAGSYYLGIDGVGFGNPTASNPTGYTDYGSLGQYMLSGTVQSKETTPPPTTTTLQVLDPNGSVHLLRDTSTDLVSVRVNGVTSAVRMSGSQIKASQFNGWQIIAAETVGSNQNQILWKETSTGRLHFWSVDSGWNYVSSGAVVSPTSSAGVLLQKQFSVDANGTPLPATPPPPTTTLQVLDPNGSVQLLRDTSTDLVSVRINGVTSAVRMSGSQIKASQFNGWQILAAETVDSNQNQILWKETSTGRLHFWSVDSGWNYVSSGAVVSPTSSAGVLLQQQFSVDANGTPLSATPPPPTISTTTPPPATNTTSTLQVLDPNGSVQLLRDTSTDLVSVRVNGVTSAVRMSGSQIKASQFNGWQILAAETVGSNQNQILWKETSTGRLHFWSVDSGWNYVSSEAIVSPTSSAGVLLQQQFMVDATGTPLSPTTQSAAAPSVDPIIGGGTSLAPSAVDTFAYDQTPLDSVLPEDLTFSTEPFLALTELASLGAANPTGTEPLVAPFPAAGLDTSATSPWLVATQPLL
jgi:hypothetical protein